MSASPPLTPPEDAEDAALAMALCIVQDDQKGWRVIFDGNDPEMLARAFTSIVLTLAGSVGVELGLEVDEMLRVLMTDTEVEP